MKFKTFAIALVVLLLGACRTAPAIYGVNAPVVSNLANPTKDDVKKAITRAGAGLGWTFQDNGPNALVGTLVLRTHTVVIDVPYSPKSYSIAYKDSTNMNYTGTSIHSNYNGWIKNLEKNIEVQLRNL